MIDEDRNKLIKIAVVVIFVILLILLIIKFTTNTIRDYRENKQLIVENIDNIDEYIIKENITVDNETKSSNMVKDYKTFYTVQNAISNYITALIEGKYDKTYSIITQDIKAKYDKNTYVEKIKTYTQNNFGTIDSIYDNSNNLKYLYLVKENVYIGEVENANGELIKIGIVLNISENTYKVFYVEI